MLNNITCIVIDDEFTCIKGLTRYIDQLPDLTLVNYYTDPMKFLQNIELIPSVDLVLMDIEMPDISGIELSQKIRSKTSKLVFTTAHTQYAYEAFGLSADAYLLKPYSFAQFACTIRKLFSEARMKPLPFPEDYFFVKEKADHLHLVKVRYRDIIVIESRKNCILIYTADCEILTYMSLGEMAKILNVYQGFVQYHRSYLIATDHISRIEGNRIRMENGVTITVGDIFKKSFNEYLSSKLLKTNGKHQ